MEQQQDKMEIEMEPKADVDVNAEDKGVTNMMSDDANGHAAEVAMQAHEPGTAAADANAEDKVDSSDSESSSSTESSSSSSDSDSSSSTESSSSSNSDSSSSTESSSTSKSYESGVVQVAVPADRRTEPIKDADDKNEAVEASSAVEATADPGAVQVDPMTEPTKDGVVRVVEVMEPLKDTDIEKEAVAGVGAGLGVGLGPGMEAWLCDRLGAGLGAGLGDGDGTGDCTSNKRKATSDMNQNDDEDYSSASDKRDEDFVDVPANKHRKSSTITSIMFTNGLGLSAENLSQLKSVTETAQSKRDFSLAFEPDPSLFCLVYRWAHKPPYNFAANVLNSNSVVARKVGLSSPFDL